MGKILKFVSILAIIGLAIAADNQTATNSTEPVNATDSANSTQTAGKNDTNEI